MEFHFIDVSCQTVRIHIVHICIGDQLTLKVIFTSALQTTMSFLNSLLLVVSEDYLCKVVFSFFCIQLLHSRTAHSLTVFKSSRCYVLFGYIIVWLVFDLFSAKISIYDQIALLCIANGLNCDGNLVITAVTACEYARKCCHVCIFIINKAALSGKLNPVHSFCIYSLADCKDYSVHINRLCFSFYRNRSATS